MKTDTTDATTQPTGTDLSPTAIFPLLSEDRRRHAVRYLDRRVGAIPLGEVAEQVAALEGCPTRDRFERIVTGLHHVHVPRLLEAGVVRSDPERETLERLPAADRLTPYLDLVATADLR